MNKLLANFISISLRPRDISDTLRVKGAMTIIQIWLNRQSLAIMERVAEILFKILPKGFLSVWITVVIAHGMFFREMWDWCQLRLMYNTCSTSTLQRGPLWHCSCHVPFLHYFVHWLRVPPKSVEYCKRWNFVSNYVISSHTHSVSVLYNFSSATHTYFHWC